MKCLTDLLQYLKNKRFVKKFEADAKNYMGGTLLATSEYCNALVDVELYKNS